MSVYEQLKPAMDDRVDADLGDSITYLIAGVPVESAPGVTTIPCFLLLQNDMGGMDAFNPHMQRWQCKIHKSYLPGRPSPRHRIRSPRLQGDYRPAADVEGEHGDYWLFDIQKAAA